MVATAIEIPVKDVAAFCERWRISELSLFGSVLRDDFRPESDIDVLVTFGSDANWSLLDVVQAETELATIMGRAVDLVERHVVEQSENWIRRRRILDSARTIYAR